MAEDDEPGYGDFLKEAGLFFGGLALIFLGIIISFGVITVVIGLPLAVVGYAMYKTSSLNKQTNDPVKVDYREK